MFGAGNRRAGWRSAAATGCAVVTLLGVTGCGDGGGGDDKAGKSPAPSPSEGPAALTEAQLEAVAFTDGEKAGVYTADEYVMDGLLSDGYTATPAVCQPLVSLAGDVSDHEPAAQVQRRVDVPDEMLGVMVDVTLRSYRNGEAAKVMQSLRKAGRACAGGLMEERAIARARYVKVEPTGLPAFAAEADEARAYRFTILDVKDRTKLYEYLTVVRAGSTTLAFRGEVLDTKDIGGVPQDIMTAQWKKFRAGRA